ncbi:GNAT family N-acetyltransferase [Paenibacillus sp. P96]|uniref:GNAT family N-acetyltransferase n=1 Tax=Paenibacillus zeirhizosphaerae TaxID=2987519 RepID=A0ABT9FMK4_9BACL|nr:GNAT family N-acetyltransferase [Paenibacillus sp. P96]MDP4095622.1 GNAT family N-acetyltransferase [Paenibacillus sp. P96]
MSVRSFQLGDASRVTELMQISLSEDCYKETIEVFARQLSWDSDLILVAEEDGELVGTLIGTIDHNHGCYYRIAIHPDHRRQGIGKALVELMEQRFQQRKVSRIWVAGDEHNKAAMPLYEAMGYGASQILQAFQKLSILAPN